MTEARKAELHRVQDQIDELERQLVNLRNRERVLLGQTVTQREPASFQPA